MKLIAAALVVAIVLVWWHKFGSDPLGGMRCPAPDHPVMTPTGPGCGQSVTFHVGGR